LSADATLKLNATRSPDFMETVRAWNHQASTTAAPNRDVVIVRRSANQTASEFSRQIQRDKFGRLLRKRASIAVAVIYNRRHFATAGFDYLRRQSAKTDKVQ